MEVQHVVVCVERNLRTGNGDFNFGIVALQDARKEEKYNIDILGDCACGAWLYTRDIAHTRMGTWTQLSQSLGPLREYAPDKMYSTRGVVSQNRSVALYSLHTHNSSPLYHTHAHTHTMCTSPLSHLQIPVDAAKATHGTRAKEGSVFLIVECAIIGAHTA